MSPEILNEVNGGCESVHCMIKIIGCYLVLFGFTAFIGTAFFPENNLVLFELNAIFIVIKAHLIIWYAQNVDLLPICTCVILVPAAWVAGMIITISGTVLNSL